jgi:hypothetical protein
MSRSQQKKNYERCRDAMKDVSMTHTQEKKQLRETVLEEVKIWTY